MIKKPKGTYDIYGQDAIMYNYIEEVIKNEMNINNVNYIRTPLFESRDLFHRSVGLSADIVTKESYDFTDRANRNLTLRPEATASIVRSLIENKLYSNNSNVIKYYYLGTMYRYERPGAGRNREFTQFGVEAFNSASVITDANIISMGYNILNNLGIECTVYLNTLGDEETRINYTNALKEYFKEHLDELCPDCKNRYDKNILRILDCKVDSGSELFENMPKLKDYLTIDATNKFNELKSLLNLLEIDYVYDDTIVRGLDYYTDIVYEFKSGDSLALGGGGRYDKLVENLEGPSVPATGFALGLERVMLALKDKELLSKEIDAFILSISKEEKYNALKIMNILKLNGYSVEMCDTDVSLKSQFKMADKLNSKYLIFLNDEDLNKGLVTIKDNVLKTEEKIDESEITDYFYDNL